MGWLVLAVIVFAIIKMDDGVGKRTVERIKTDEDKGPHGRLIKR